MTITLKLNDDTYRRARKLAETQQQAVADVLADWSVYSDQQEQRRQVAWRR